jgi:hypothetical protein
MYVPYLVIAAASSSFGFFLWISTSAADAAAAADDAPSALSGQLPPLHDVSVRNDVKM